MSRLSSSEPASSASTGRDPISQVWKRTEWLALALLAVLGAGAILYSTDPHPWAFSDAVEFVMSARNLVRGDGLGMVLASGRFAPISHFPPLYAVLLAIPGWIGVDPLDAARWLDVTCLVLLLGLVALVATSLLESPGIGFSSSILVISSPLMLRLFTGVASESIFLPLSLASVISIAAYTAGRSRILLFVGAVMAGMAILSRYAGLSLLISGPLSLVFLSRSGGWRRIADSVIFVAVASLPIVAWILVNRSIGGESPREFHLALPGLWDQLRSFRGRSVDGLWSFLPFVDLLGVPTYRFKLGVLVVIALAMAIALLILFRRSRGPTWNHPPGSADVSLALFLFAAIYLAGLALASAGTRPAPDVDTRILSPLWIPAWIILLELIHIGLARTGRRRLSVWLPLGVAILVAARSLPESVDLVTDLHDNGGGYTGRQWRASETIQAIRELPTQTPIISNETAAILLLAGRASYDIPELVTATPKEEFLPFGSDLDDPIERIFREDGAALVLFYSFPNQLEALYQDRRDARLRSFTEGLEPQVVTSDGSIYFYARWESGDPSYFSDGAEALLHR